MARVRSTFIEFFKSKPAQGNGHTFVASSPVVPHDDPTLLFTNAGMNQFKPCFLNSTKPGSPLHGLRRAVNSQKCIRAGGKHNDLDDVGKDTYHHTFFEMLGNWSFGDYFKKEAVDWSWELLTKVYGLPPAALYASYFGGNKEAGLEPDLETKALWEKYLPPERVIPGNMKDNFWEMGETGPCGPCTEIHVDRITAMGIEQRSVPGKVNAGDPDVIEIWNNVFIQFNREEGGGLKQLPAKHVDTGMGLERLTSILQNKRSNYDTDVFFPIFAEIERLTKGRHSYHGRLGAADKDHTDTAFRVIADHIRTLTFAVTDGATPSNEGRGYVLRRILRRAVRYGRQTLGLEAGFFSRLVPVVVEHFGDAFPELTKNPGRVIEILKDEEDSFGKTLDRGIRLFDEAAKHGKVSGEDAFKLHDTFGFPIDLTVQMAEERGISVDQAGYETLMEAAREKARAGSGGKFSAAATGMVLQPDTLAKLEHQRIAKTADADKFHGRTVSATVKAIWNGHNFDEHAKASAGTLKPIGVVLDVTNFYAEMGGQETDHGTINMEKRHGEFRVEHVQNFGGYVLHAGLMTKGELHVGDTVECRVDAQRRGMIASNHTATHLLNLALRANLGEGVEQKGSLVAPDRFRFDFSHPKAVDGEALAKIEAKVRHDIHEDLTVYADIAPLYVAKNVRGLRAVFGEQYPDPVRVVSIGVPVRDLLDSADNPAWQEVSVEFCGGTHVETTSQIRTFALVSEEAVAKGIRRITALTGVAANAAFEAADQMFQKISSAATTQGEVLAAAVQELTGELETLTLPASRKAELRTKLASLAERVKGEQKQAGAARANQAAARAKVIAEDAAKNAEQVIVATIEAGSDRNALQHAVNTVVQVNPRSAVMLFSPDEEGGKVSIAAAVPMAIIHKGLKAGDWVRIASEVVGGKGGGRPESASGGGTNLAKVKDAIETANLHARKLVGL
ncbi:MAG TPA: alanine--tRNA ligase [Phycisphaerales bacterium]|nr:alanine--tRNA ligase [Phycisphaerales bacterium]